MARSVFATVCCFVSVLAMSGTALADPQCSGVVITDVVEGAAGALTPVGERCYERGPGVPFYYDAPTNHLRIEVEVTPSSVTHFDAATAEALGAQPITDLIKPVPAGQGEADSRPE